MSNALPTFVDLSSPTSLEKGKSSFLSLTVLAFVVPGLVATMALPAYAYSPPDAAVAETAQAAASLQQLKEAEAQTVFVSAAAEVTTVARDSFGVTSAAEIELASYVPNTGPSVADLLADPPYPSFSLDAVAAVARTYAGVPYVFGGATPSGFDCSGLVMYVYAQFGIALPHSVTGQASMGTPIAREAALPGDIVVMDGGSHDGIYLGNGMFIDAPYAGKPVQIRPIYDNDYYFVRLGI